MTPFRVGRTKRGDVRVELFNTPTNIWHGFVLTEAEAKALAREICAQAKTSPADLTADKYTEP